MKNRTYYSLKVLICVFLFVSVILPLIMLICNIHPQDIQKVFQAPQFFPMLVNSLVCTTSATIISISLALALAWCVNRSSMRYRSLFSMAFTLPMLIPSISHGMGLVFLFGDNGLITNFLGININLYGYTGIIMGSILYAFPMAFLMLNDVFRYEDYTTYEAASVLGLSKAQQFLTITLTNLKRPLLSAVFATFTMIFTDYGVPLMVGGKTMTLPVYMYREVIGLLDFSKGAIIGVILLIPALIAFWLDLKNENATGSSTIIRSYQIKPNKKRDRIAYIFCVTIVCLISLPILSFVALSFVEHYPIDLSFSFSNVQKAFALGIGSYFMNSLAIAFATALIGLCFTYMSAYITARGKRNLANISIHLISMISLAIPGIVLGLGYVLTFRGSAIYGTFALLIMVNITHFFASPYLLAYNSLSNFNEKMEDVSVTLGIGKWRMLMDVYLPPTKATIIEMFSYMFVNAMVTISAVSFLANFRNMPLALMIPQFDSQSLIEATAFISVLILFVNGMMKLVVYGMKRKLTNQ